MKTCVLTIHLHQQLVQRVLLFALASKVSSSPLPPHSVDFVDEKDAGRVLPRHGEHVSHLQGGKSTVQSVLMVKLLRHHLTHPGRTDAHKHLKELRAVDGDEGDVGLSGCSFGQQGLAGSWRSRQHGTLTR